MLIAFVFVLGAPGKDQGTLGLDKTRTPWPLPEFAVPVAASKLEGDANVAQDDCETSRSPARGCAADPACRIPGAGVIPAFAISSTARW